MLHNSVLCNYIAYEIRVLLLFLLTAFIVFFNIIFNTSVVCNSIHLFDFIENNKICTFEVLLLIKRNYSKRYTPFIKKII